MSKDNCSYMFPKPKVVYCLYYPSNISPHSESSGAKQNKTKHEVKHVDLLVLSGTAFSTSLLISSLVNWRKALYFEVFSPGRGYWLRAGIIG